ncbi:flagellar basal body L-ring protein FlgH [Sphingomonas donggukensis]|uniref:Flagellar L-ring protein n=1 Tax=Sphingomonas donggukensis TaxID=2949093 RepID=A0ABY4TT08_9SPHN|nr:flagellar basal body L-ring protein FlgH [Sphingomonas donggukensis]URW75536.1 flagellar basal body L-ring protein FlgH [Sphingomonas donggukensis]
MRTLLLACAALSAVAATPADAGLFGSKKKAVPPPEYRTVYAPPPAPVPAPANGAIFQVAGGYGGLYEGTRARAVGDPLTIVLVERTSASKSAGTKLDSGGGFGITPPTTGALNLFNQSDASISGKRNFGGTGTADQSNALSGEISVTVAEVLPNGTMIVQGQKTVTLNRGDEFVQIRGLVRPADISADNRVLSTRVADAKIAYTGRGDVARASRQGWLSRFFQVVSPF